MKTNSKKELEEIREEAEFIFNTEYPVDMPYEEPKVITLKKKDGSSLNMKRAQLGEWLEELLKPNGIYFLDFDFSKPDDYNLHYLDHDNGKLMEMNMPAIEYHDEDPKKEFMDKLIFDLTLFQSGEPIVVFGKASFADALKNIAEIYYEYAVDIDSIIDRLVDMEQIFKEQYYWDSRFKGNTVKAIYPVLCSGGTYKAPIVCNSLAMYKIYMAILSIYLQAHVPVDTMKMVA